MFKYFDFKRVVRYIFLIIASLPIRGYHRYHFLKLAGIKIKGKFTSDNFRSLEVTLLSIWYILIINIRYKFNVMI